MSYNDFSLSRDLSRPRDQRVMWFFVGGSMVSHDPAKFGGHRHCGSGDLMFLVVEGQDSTCPCFNLPLQFISKIYGIPC